MEFLEPWFFHTSYHLSISLLFITVQNRVYVLWYAQHWYSGFFELLQAYMATATIWIWFIFVLMFMVYTYTCTVVVNFSASFIQGRQLLVTVEWKDPSALLDRCIMLYVSQNIRGHSFLSSRVDIQVTLSQSQYIKLWCILIFVKFAGLVWLCITWHGIFFFILLGLEQTLW